MSTSDLIKIISRVYLPSEYVGLREKAYSLISNYKLPRYVKVDDRITALFEDAVTVWFQIEETVFLEGVDDEKILNEAVRTYSPMIPNDNEVSMTLFVYIYNDNELRNLLPLYRGIEKSVFLEIDGQRINAIPIYPEDYGPNAQPRSIHYLKFREDSLDRKINNANEVRLVVTHNMVNKSVKLTIEQINALRNSIKRSQIPWAI
ncbi:MAG: DUF3501 family protein [Vulcanisaeta sp.]